MQELYLMISNTRDVYIVLGVKGYIGAKYKSFLESQGKQVEGLSHSDIDYTDPRVFDEFMKYNQPRWKDKQVFVINCAGKCGKPNVDQCEVKKRETIDLNVILPALLSEVCIQNDAVFCHVSSGCIYSGKAKQVFTEIDPPNFTFDNPSHSFYSGTKAMGEEYIHKNPRCYIWRIRMPFDEVHSSRNYLSKLMTYDTLVNAKNSLTHIGEFIRCSSEMMETGAAYGIYNMVNEDGITTKDITKLLIENWSTISSEPKKKFKFFPSIAQFNKIVKTPRSNCVLDCSKVNSLLGVTRMPKVKDSITNALKNWH